MPSAMVGPPHGPSRRPSAAVLKRARLALALLALTAACDRGGDPAAYRVTLDVAPEIRALGSDDDFVADPAVERLVAMGTPVVPVLAEALRREPSAARVRVVEILSRLPGDARLPLLIDAARDADADVRAEALAALGTLRDARAQAAVEGALRDPDASVRHAAVQACAAVCEGGAALATLADLGVHDPALPNGLAAALAVQQVVAAGPPERAALVRHAVDERARPAASAAAPLERARAALLVAALGDPAAVPALLAAAADATLPVHVRLPAIAALGTLGDAAVVPALGRLVTDAQTGIARQSDAALGRLADRRITGAADARLAYRGERAGAYPGVVR
jgi:HEAT repeat protein